MANFPEDFWIDANGVPTERTRFAGHELIVHYEDVPQKDLTVVDGIPCTTPLRTVIDLAIDVDEETLVRMVRDCLHRRLFTVEEGLARTAEPDICSRPGARRLRGLLESPDRLR